MEIVCKKYYFDEEHTMLHSEIWTKVEGKIITTYRAQGPAKIFYHKNGKVKTEVWVQDGDVIGEIMNEYSSDGNKVMSIHHDGNKYIRIDY